MKNLNSKILIFFLILSLLLPMAVPVYADYNPSVFRLTSLGIIENYEEERIVSRGEAVYSFVKLLLDEIPAGAQAPFADVPLEHKYSDAISLAVGMGMVSGVPGGLFHPDEPALGVHLVKMAVITLGFGSVAESEGGYDGGYKAVAARLGILTGFDMDSSVTMKQLAALLDKMLDTYPLEPVWGTDKNALSESTMLEKILNRTNAASVKGGIVTAAGKSAMNTYSELRENEISIDGEVFRYYGSDAKEFFGKSVDAYYRPDDITGESVVIALMLRYNNKITFVKNDDIMSLTKSACTYAVSVDTIETASISGTASFVYNGKKFSPEGENIELHNGDVTLIDNNGDKVIDLVFVEEYESMIIDRISTAGSRIFFKDTTPFREKTAFEFDIDDKDKEYIITNENGDAINFEDLKADSVVTIKSSLDETINIVSVTEKTLEGTISEIDATEKVFTVNDEVYPLYAKNADKLLARYRAGQKVLFYLNSYGEIIDGEVGTDGFYGYVLAAHRGSGLEGSVQIRMATSGSSQKLSEIIDKQEIISYEYANELKTFTLSDNVDYGIADDTGNISTKRISSSLITLDDLEGSAVCYKIGADNKISYLAVTPIDFYEFKQSITYAFNAALNSFGGISNSKAFFVGKGTNVICIPNVPNPTEEDYTVDVTITDDTTTNIVMPIGIDDETQIAQCAIIMASMKGGDVKPFTTKTKYSIVGSVKSFINESGEQCYKMDVLTGDEFLQPTILEGEPNALKVAALRCGDLIRYNTKSNGEISNIQKVVGMYDFGSVYAENMDGTVFGRVSDVQLNRLDDFLNEMVDIVTFEDLGSGSKAFKILRDDGPVVYSYRKSTGVIKAAETDEIYAGQELFLLQSDNVVKAVVIFED